MYCNKCLISTHNDFRTCPREGNENDILIIGEAPGATENKTKIPFTGKAGKYLRRYLDEYELTSFCSITNIVKCQPYRNDTPTETEITKCSPYLIEDIKVVKPKLIILAGTTATRYFTGAMFITPLVNKPFVRGNTIIIPIYHPSHIMRENREVDYYISFNTISDIYSKINKYYLKKYVDISSQQPSVRSQ